MRPEDVAAVEGVERFDEAVEETAIHIAVEWERSRNARVQDVSKPALAREVRRIVVGFVVNRLLAAESGASANSTT